MEGLTGVILQTPTERSKPPYGLAARAGQKKSGRRLLARWQIGALDEKSFFRLRQRERNQCTR
ncbi:hypothetical protein [Pseudobacillus wudalianchiensis]|uniref:hypothetical protein n=1 Tax=Pseudobacillus wudalianchiensis TaxID=1743143 RepID=UPI0011478630|nr:hypothetical protein [Bacillus wudalianchiensis]